MRRKGDDPTKERYKSGTVLKNTTQVSKFKEKTPSSHINLLRIQWKFNFLKRSHKKELKQITSL